MVKKNIIWIILFLNAFSCNSQNGNVSLILYTDFVNPKSTYDRMVSEMIETNLIDSIKIIGRPILESQIDIQIDTSLINAFGLSITDVNNQINTAINLCKDFNEISSKYAVTNSGQQVSFREFAKFYVKPVYYKPEIFVPNPEVYYYEKRPAVRIELYCTRKNVRTLIKYIEHNIQNYADAPSSNYLNRIEYRIVK